MHAIQFNIIRSSDRQLFDAINAMITDSDDRIAVSSLKLTYLFDESIEITAQDIPNHPQLTSTLTDHIRVFRYVDINTALGRIRIVRSDPGLNGKAADNHRDNSQPFDTVAVDPRGDPQLKPEEFSRLVGFAQQYLGQSPINALQTFLGEDAKRHFDAREVALARLETMVAKLTYDLEDARKAREVEFQAKEALLLNHRKEVDEKFTIKSQELESQHQERERQLDEREKQLDLQDAKAARRKQRSEMKEQFEEWSRQFDITSTTRNLRWIIHALSIGLLLAFGTAAGFYLNQSLQQLETPQLIAVHIKQAVLTALFVATSIFYAKWNTQWFQKRANEEFRLKRMELDFDRASWLVELMFQWKDEHKEDPLPHELIERLSGQLFVAEREDQPPTHPYEALASAIFGASSKVKIGPTGAELELDRKGLQKLRKSDE